MKTLLFSIGIMLLSVFCNAQARLSMSKYRNFIPADTVTYGTNVQLQVFIKNTGNTIFTGNINLIAKRDTVPSIGIVLDSIIISSVTLLPNSGDSIPAILEFVPTASVMPGTFKVNGNGNVIVVWPKSPSALFGDSVRPVLFINGTVGLNELSESNAVIYPNPTSNKVFIKLTENQIPKKYQVFDVFGRKVKEVEWIDSVDVSELNNGLYWVILFTENKSYKTKIIKQ